MPSSFSSVFDQKVLGGILLIVGTCLGGAMLALPISNSGTGFIVSSGYLVAVWFFMSICSYMILEVNLLFPPGTNLLTMAGKTLGRFGQLATITTYFALLYNLLSAYISGGSGILINITKSLGYVINQNVAAISFVLIFGYFVFSKMNRLDFVNRSFIIFKLILFIFIIVLSFTSIEIDNLFVVNSMYTHGIVMVLCTSFGFGVVIPSLRQYLDDDPKKLRVAVIAGSIIPLIAYIIWDLVLMGSLGTEMLMNLADDNQPTNKMIDIFAVLVESRLAVNLLHIFAAICLITSFFGIALSMSDFLADSIGVVKKGFAKLGIFFLTFIPPLILVTWFEEGFIAALRYAGACCVVLHIFLPIMMVWSRIDDIDWARDYALFFKIGSIFTLALFSYIVFINF